MKKPPVRVVGHDRRQADRVKSLEAKVKRMEREARSAAKAEQALRERIARDKEIAQAIRDAADVTAAEPRAPYVPLANNAKARPIVELCIGVNDTHFGAVVDPARTSGRYAYNWTLAEYGFRSYIADVISHAHNLQSAYQIRSARVLALGDIINGELHGVDSVVENEFPVPVQIVRAGALLTESVEALSAAFPEVVVDWVPGNHDRCDVKPNSNKADERSFGFTVAEWVAHGTRRCPNVKVVRHTDNLPTVNINETTFGLAHGHGIAMYKRTPYYGLRDLLVSRILEALDYKGEPPQVVCVGHFHEQSITDDGRVMLLPSLMGPSHWSRDKGFRGRPAQMTWFVGKHGPFGHVAWRRQVPGEVGR